MDHTTTVAGGDPEQVIAELRRRLESTPRAVRPLEHASLRYALGLAYAERPSGERQLNLSRAVAAYQEAAPLFTVQHHPVERARVHTALGAAQRELGSTREAVQACSHAAELLEDADVLGERGAALNNLGLAHSDLGEHEQAVSALTEAVEAFGKAGETRQQAMARHNLGQAQAASGDQPSAIATYEQGLAEADPEEAPYQWGLLHHALGVSLTAVGEPARAKEAFAASLQVFTRPRYPFQYALAKNNYGLACAQVNDVNSLRRAVAAYEDALRVLDVRMHRAQWEQVYRNLELAESALAEQGAQSSRVEHFVALVASIEEEEERIGLLRERYASVVELPERQRDDALTEMEMAVQALPEELAHRFVGSWLSMLMELPNDQLVAALQARLAAEAQLEPEQRREAARVLDRVIQDQLLSPQRMKVRDTLTSLGWERP